MRTARQRPGFFPTEPIAADSRRTRKARYLRVDISRLRLLGQLVDDKAHLMHVYKIGRDIVAEDAPKKIRPGNVDCGAGVAVLALAVASALFTITLPGSFSGPSSLLGETSHQRL